MYDILIHAYTAFSLSQTSFCFQWGMINSEAHDRSKYWEKLSVDCIPLKGVSISSFPRLREHVQGSIEIV